MGVLDETRPPRQTFLSFSPPSISEEEIAAVVEVMRSDWITTGPKSRQFEEAFASYLGAAAALAVNSCTGALHVALAALGIGPGDEVITTPMTFISTINVIEHVGATPILADIDPVTLNIDPAVVETCITPRTKAILPVHFAGHPVDMRPLLDLARAHGLYIIEDAAHALPAAYEDRPVGTLGDLTAFSFYATKNLTTAEGGMLTGHPDLIQNARRWSLHGMNRDAWKRYSAEGSWYYEVEVPGFKYNMTDIQAAIGMVQLGRLAEFQERRRDIVKTYTAAFSQLEAVEPPVERNNVKHAWHLYVLRLHLDQLTIDRTRFIDELTARQIGTSVHFIPVPLHPYYRDRYGWDAGTTPLANAEYQRTISLPLHPRLTDEEVSDVIAAVSGVIQTFAR